jgi:hypothetical protein
MASASLHHITTGFPHQHWTPIMDVKALQGEINANSMSVHSNRGDGQSGHFILTCRPSTWANSQLPGAPPFIAPLNPGILPDTVQMTVAQRTVALADTSKTKWSGKHSFSLRTPFDSNSSRRFHRRTSARFSIRNTVIPGCPHSPYSPTYGQSTVLSAPMRSKQSPWPYIPQHGTLPHRSKISTTRSRAMLTLPYQATL